MGAIKRSNTEPIRYPSGEELLLRMVLDPILNELTLIRRLLITLPKRMRTAELPQHDGTPDGKLETVERLLHRHYNLTLRELRGPSRHREIAWPRHVACFLARTCFGLSENVAARWIGRDHRAVWNSVRRVRAALESGDRSYARDLEVLKTILDEIKQSRQVNGAKKHETRHSHNQPTGT